MDFEALKSQLDSINTPYRNGIDSKLLNSY